MMTASDGYKTAIRRSARLGLALRITCLDGTVYAFNNQMLNVTLPELTVGPVTVPTDTYVGGECRFPGSMDRSVDLTQPGAWDWTVLLGGQVSKTAVAADKLFGAKYTFVHYNRANVADQVLFGRGKVGERLKFGGLQATFSMKGLSGDLQQQVLEVTRATSNKTWGDPELDLIDLTGNTHDGHACRVTSTITAVGSKTRRQLTVSATSGFPSQRFTNGTILFSGGDNDGLEAGIIIYDAATGALTLDRNTRAPMQVGDGVRVQIGPPVTIEDWRIYTGSGFGYPAQPGIPTADKVNAVQ